ncbi:MazG nucleotide pyrophosphohydrolase domain-containing protein [Halobacterium jilantaiense]|uniref:NTP pyrophosphatase, house-cleaning of non-canonical NTPs n=1 Tax=Halobacterium jilantaiense TaxID=355548 RepID=A0A1I0MYV3_9EURY|nr:MazG nucleotide pyrophosphohydrolase domain-containing protein [Halobacterium jilantaiense]SEV94004.1 NTP pyrophosphatase, house-cleaning of non-canonical NTPs [Halobacterium jilantaiense]
MDDQARVAAFLDAHDLRAPPENRVLDLASEVGELAKNVNETTDYGTTDGVDVDRDELGDALFCLLALADELDYDAGDALDEALAKYDARLDESGTAGSGA